MEFEITRQTVVAPSRKLSWRYELDGDPITVVIRDRRWAQPEYPAMTRSEEEEVYT